MGNLYTSHVIVKGGSTEGHTSSRLTEELQELGSSSSDMTGAEMLASWVLLMSKGNETVG